jgi:hypothetical protein
MTTLFARLNSGNLLEVPTEASEGSNVSLGGELEGVFGCDGNNILLEEQKWRLDGIHISRSVMLLGLLAEARAREEEMQTRLKAIVQAPTENAANTTKG